MTLTNTLEELIDKTYTKIESKYLDQQLLSERAILAPETEMFVL